MRRIGIAVIIILGVIASNSCMAADGSRITHFALLAGGVGLKVAAVVFEEQAQEAYDSYLHTARPSEMREFTDEYDQKHRQSQILSKTGVGLIGLAAFLALLEQFQMPDEVQVSFEPRAIRLNYRLDFTR